MVNEALVVALSSFNRNLASSQTSFRAGRSFAPPKFIYEKSVCLSFYSKGSSRHTMEGLIAQETNEVLSRFNTRTAG